MLPTHFFSDPHFGHEHLVQMRGFSNIEEMNATLRLNYRRAADILYDNKSESMVTIWTGDCFWAGFDGAMLLRDLPGCKILVRGNHDGSMTKMLNFGFDLVVDALDIMIAGKRVHVRHLPPLGWVHAGRGVDDRYPDRRPPAPAKDQYLIHGHTHTSTRKIGRCVHVGVDAWDYAPVSIEQIEKLIQEP